MSIFRVFKPFFVDKSGRWKEMYYVFMAHPQSLKIRKLVENIAGKSINILDIGGRKSPYTRRLKGRVTILDKVSDSDGYLGFTKEFVDSFKQENSVCTVVGDATDMPFPNDTFDSFLCIEVIEHIPEDDKAIGEMARVLSPSGYGLLTTPNGAVVPNINPYHIRHYLPVEFKKLLENHFSNVQVFSIVRWPRFSHYLSLKLRQFRVLDVILYSLIRPVYLMIDYLTPSSNSFNGVTLVAIVQYPKHNKKIEVKSR
jgi:ubiquinone/menaquinone biosynthesis C-methylase UbiE